MMDGLYMVCPECGEIEQDGWEEVYKNYNVYSVSTNGNWVITNYDFTMKSEFVMLRHYCGFETSEYQKEDLTIKVINNKVVDVGRYWKEHMEKLKKIVSNYGLELDIGGD